MTAVDDRKHRLFDHLRPAIIPLPGEFGQRDEHVELRQHQRGRLNPPPLGRHGVAKLHEQLVFQFLRLFVGREHFFFVFLQLRRDVALGVFDGLLADVIGGNPFAVGVRDLDVIAEHLVEADLQVRNARPLGLLGLIAGDPLLAAAGEFAEIVQLGVEAVANESAVARRKRAIVQQARLQHAAQARDKDRSPLQVRRSSVLFRPVSLTLIDGSERSVRPRKFKSRGLARPVVTRANSRSTS